MRANTQSDTIKISVCHIHSEKQSTLGAIVTGNSNRTQPIRWTNLTTCRRITAWSVKLVFENMYYWMELSGKEVVHLCICYLRLSLLLLPSHLSVFALTEVKCFVRSSQTNDCFASYTFFSQFFSGSFFTKSGLLNISAVISIFSATNSWY